MTFQEGGSFEGGRVRRRRGAVVAGGGIGVIGIVVLLLAQLTGVDLGPVLSGVGTDGGTGQTAAGSPDGTVGDCTAAQANTDPACRLSATVQSLDAFWAGQFDPAADVPLPEVVEFSASTSTACGAATASTGPFYCPPEQTIYLDLGFYDLLRDRFGAADGPLAEMYVTAHEYGHHIQQITGVMDAADRQGTGADSDSVRIELQADCYAGLWAGHAATTLDPDTGVPFLEPITATQLADALSAAAAVGDDHIQAASGGQVTPDSWTHGSSEQRERWFTTGYEQGTPGACDTFAAATL